MKKLFLVASISLLFALNQNYAQITAEEIVSNYLEAIGGEEAIAEVKSMKSSCIGKAQGMDIPITMVQVAPSSMRMDMNFQGQEITQMSFNGEEGWSTNFMTMEAERWDATDSEINKQEFDFPEPFLNYADKGYSISLEEDEVVEGTECYQIKLTKNPVTIEGEEVANEDFYFFDKESGVPIMSRSFEKKGEMKGKAIETYMSDYDEVDGLYYPFTVSQKMDGNMIFSVVVEEIILNPEIEEGFFDYPESVSDDAPAPEQPQEEPEAPAKPAAPVKSKGIEK